MVIEISEQTRQEEMRDRINRFQVDLKALEENYKVKLNPQLMASPNGIIPLLNIVDLKYREKKSELEKPLTPEDLEKIKESKDKIKK